MSDRIQRWTDTDKYVGALKAKANIVGQLLPNQCALTEPGLRITNSTSSTHRSSWQNFLEPLSKYTKKLQNRTWCILWDRVCTKPATALNAAWPTLPWDAPQSTPQKQSRGNPRPTFSVQSKGKGGHVLPWSCSLSRVPQARREGRSTPPTQRSRHRAACLITGREGDNLP